MSAAASLSSPNSAAATATSSSSLTSTSAAGGGISAVPSSSSLSSSVTMISSPVSSSSSPLLVSSPDSSVNGNGGPMALSFVSPTAAAAAAANSNHNNGFVGILKKKEKGLLSSTFKVYVVAIRGCYFEMYKTKDMKTNKPLGQPVRVLDLRRFRLISCNASTDFVLSDGKESQEFVARSSEECQMWKNEVEAALQRRDDVGERPEDPTAKILCNTGDAPTTESGDRLEALERKVQQLTEQIMGQNGQSIVDDNIRILQGQICHYETHFQVERALAASVLHELRSTRQRMQVELETTTAGSQSTDQIRAWEEKVQQLTAEKQQLQSQIQAMKSSKASSDDVDKLKATITRNEENHKMQLEKSKAAEDSRKQEIQQLGKEIARLEQEAAEAKQRLEDSELARDAERVQIQKRYSDSEASLKAQLQTANNQNAALKEKMMLQDKEAKQSEELLRQQIREMERNSDKDELLETQRCELEVLRQKMRLYDQAAAETKKKLEDQHSLYEAQCVEMAKLKEEIRLLKSERVEEEKAHGDHIALLQYELRRMNSQSSPKVQAHDGSPVAPPSPIPLSPTTQTSTPSTSQN